MKFSNIFEVEIPFSEYAVSTYHFDLEAIKEGLNDAGKHEALRLASSDEALTSYKQAIAREYAGFLNSTIIDQLYPYEAEELDPLIMPSYNDDSIKALFNISQLPEIEGFDVLQYSTRGSFTFIELLIEISREVSDGLIGEYLDKPYNEWRSDDINVLIIAIVAMLGYEADVVLPALERWPDALEGYEHLVFYEEYFGYFVEEANASNLEQAAGSDSVWGRIAGLLLSEDEEEAVNER